MAPALLRGVAFLLFIDCGDLRGRRAQHPDRDCALMAPRLTQLVGLTRAQGLWRIRLRRISFSR